LTQVTEVTDRLIKLGRDRAAAELCLSAGFHKEALKIALRARLWGVGELVCQERPELSKELAAARAMEAEDIEENLVPFAEYVRKGREESARRPLPLARRLARSVCCCCGCEGEGGEEDGSNADPSTPARAGRRARWCGGLGAKRHEGGQAAKSKDWGVGVDEGGLSAAPAGVLASICFPCAAAGAVCAPYYAAVREKLVRLRNVYPLLALAQAAAMVFVSRDFLALSSFDARSRMAVVSGGTQMTVAQPEHNWTLPLLLARELVGLAALFAMWVCWERQRYYRQLVSSPLLMQLGMLLLAVGNAALFVHLHAELRWQYTPVRYSSWECAYYTCHSAACGVLCLGVKRSWWDLLSLLIVPATALVYMLDPGLRFVAFVAQMPLAAMLSLKLFRCFQDVRLLLVPAFVVMVHMGLSCLLLFFPSVLLVVLRDALADVVGSLLLCLCLWIIPSTIEWVEDEELADLQGVGDAETARRELEQVRLQNRVPKGYETLYEVNRARHDAERLKELMTGQNPDMFAELNRVYSPDIVEAEPRPSSGPRTIEQRRADLAAMRGAVLDTNGGGFDYSKFGAEPPPPRPDSHFSDAPGKSMAQMDPRRRSSADSSRAPSVASAASIDLDVSSVSNLWRSPVTPRADSGAAAAHGHAKEGRDRTDSHVSISSRGSVMSMASAASAADFPPSGGSPAAPRSVPDGFAIQLDKLPQEGRKLVLKDSLQPPVRQDAALTAPAAWGPAEEALRRADSAMGGNAHEGRATPNGRPKKSPSSGRGNPPPPGTPRVGGPPLSNAGWGSLMKPPPPGGEAGAGAGSPGRVGGGGDASPSSSIPQLGVMPLHFAGDDDAKSVASVFSVGFPRDALTQPSASSGQVSSPMILLPPRARESEREKCSV
jgi:hypothetical protein